MTLKLVPKPSSAGEISTRSTRIVPSIPVIEPSAKLTGPENEPVANSGALVRIPPKPALMICCSRSIVSLKSMIQSDRSLWNAAMITAVPREKYFSIEMSKLCDS